MKTSSRAAAATVRMLLPAVLGLSVLTLVAPVQPASAQAVNKCRAVVQGPFTSPTQILGISGHRVSATGYGSCDEPVQTLALAVGVYSVGAGMSGKNPYTKFNTATISGGVSAGFAGETVCYMATAETAALYAEGDLAASECRGTSEPED